MTSIHKTTKCTNKSWWKKHVFYFYDFTFIICVIFWCSLVCFSRSLVVAIVEQTCMHTPFMFNNFLKALCTSYSAFFFMYTTIEMYRKKCLKKIVRVVTSSTKATTFEWINIIKDMSFLRDRERETIRVKGGKQNCQWWRCIVRCILFYETRKKLSMKCEMWIKCFESIIFFSCDDAMTFKVVSYSKCYSFYKRQDMF